MSGTGAGAPREGAESGIPRERAGAGEDRATRLRRLAMRASRRGIKEMDVILGPWAAENLAALDADDLDRFEALLGENDQDLLRWVTGQAKAPAALSPLLSRIAADAEARHRPRR